MKLQFLQRFQRLGPLLLGATLLAFVLGSIGCNTAHGFGQDLEKTGEKIQDGTR